MKGKFDITGRTPGHPVPSPMGDAVDRFVSGAEPMTTVTVRVPPVTPPRQGVSPRAAPPSGDAADLDTPGRRPWCVVMDG
jgi:hypothetical protein